MINLYSKTFVFLLFLAILQFSANGQTAQTISGRVTDSNNSAISTASVSVRERASGAEFSTVTDAAGNFSFPDLSIKDYRLIVRAAGFSDAVREIQFAELGQPLEIRLSVGNLTESVTVTATRTELATTETAVPVTVVGRGEIERRNLNTVGDIFRDLPGTSTTGEGAFQVRPRIRGLDSNRVLILIDGERLNNARTSTGLSGVESGLVEVEQIETVEVVRGAGSVLYGTDALAGTINIITKDAPRRTENDFRFGGSFNSYFSSNEKGRRGSLALTGSGKFFAFRVAQSLERYDNYFAGKTDKLNLTAASGITARGEVLNSQSHGGNTQLTTRFFFNENNDLRLNVERRRAANIGSPTLNLESGFNAFFPYSDRDKFNGRFETRNLTDNLAKIAASFYVQRQKRSFDNILSVPPAPPFFPGINNFSETVTDTKSIGFDVQSNWILGSRNFLTAGISYFRDENKDFRFQESRIPVVRQNRSQNVPNADFGSFAFFAQDEFEATSRLKFIAGVRVDRFFSSSSATDGFSLSVLTAAQQQILGIAGLDTGLSVKENAVTGDFGAVFRATDKISLTGRVGRSFRVANLFERFFTGAGSVGGFVVGNPNLKPESGINFDTGVKVRTAKFAATFTYFNNHYRNFLTTQQVFSNQQPIRLANETPVSQTVNFGRTRIQGFEGEFEVPIKFSGGFLTPSGNFSYLRGDDLEAKEPLNIAPPLKTVLNLRWQDAAARYYGEANTRIVGKQNRLAKSFLISNGGAEPGFAVTDLRGGYTFRREHYNFSVNTGINNIFNRFYNEQLVFAPARGRSFVIGTSLNFF